MTTDETAIDYRALLMKYIEYASECEGSTNLGFRRGYVDFTDEEWAELQRIEDEMFAIIRARNAMKGPHVS